MFTTLQIALLSLQVTLLNQQVQTIATIQAPVVMHMTQEEQALAEIFPDAPIMQTVAFCESRKKQFNHNGTVIKNWNKDGTYDEGILEINSKHAKEAKVLGFDIQTLTGNLEYARFLYDREGLRPWLSSFKCWSQGSAADDGSGYGRIEVEADRTPNA